MQITKSHGDDFGWRWSGGEFSVDSLYSLAGTHIRVAEFQYLLN
jgi:hypothetical protein